MAITEKIQKYVLELPVALQSEVLDYVEYLVSKSKRETMRDENMDWSNLSLGNAMRGMEDEPALYAASDIKVSFQ